MFIKTIITKFSQTIKLRIVQNNSAIALQLLDSGPIIVCRDTNVPDNYFTVFITLIFSNFVTDSSIIVGFVGTLKLLNHFTLFLWFIFLCILNSLDTVLTWWSTWNLDTASGWYPGAPCVWYPLPDSPLDYAASIDTDSFTIFLCIIFPTCSYFICYSVITSFVWWITSGNILLSTIWVIFCNISVNTPVEAFGLISHFTFVFEATENMYSIKVIDAEQFWNSYLPGVTLIIRETGSTRCV